jgi:hypothetical protein
MKCNNLHPKREKNAKKLQRRPPPLALHKNRPGSLKVQKHGVAVLRNGVIAHNTYHGTHVADMILT